MTKLQLPTGYRDAKKLHQNLRKKPEKYWANRGQKRAVRLFRTMAERVPAYKDFLASNNFSPRTVKSIKDFHKIPTINKDNYLRRYSKEMLCWDGQFPQGQWVISTTSGSTGEPYYFPREKSQDWQYAICAELYLRNNFQIHKKSTLYIVAFPMGAWIGGLFTYEALKLVAGKKGYNLSIITPGIHKQEVINAVKQLGSHFDQVIIGAYAPFLKDILDDGKRQGISWSNHDIGFVFSAEAFTETFRDYVFDEVRPKEPLRASLNHYGTVDLGTMSHETPETVMIRRMLAEGGELNLLLPEAVRQPSLTQFIPELFYFEEVDKNLLCSAYSGIPLVRYDLKDYGGVISRDDATKSLKASGYDVRALAKKNNIKDTLWNLPYVYVYERDDFSVSYYAFLIYPDMVRRALQSKSLKDYLTGKFTMLVDYDTTGRQKLHIHTELKHAVELSPRLTASVLDVVHSGLLEDSSEYRETFSMVGDESKPLIHLHQYESQEYFRPGTKQKWVIK